MKFSSAQHFGFGGGLCWADAADAAHGRVGPVVPTLIHIQLWRTLDIKVSGRRGRL